MTPTHARFLRWDRAGVVVFQASNYKKDPGFLCEFLWRFSHLSHEQRGGDISVVVATKDEEGIFKQAIEAHVHIQLGAQLQDVMQAEYVCKDSNTREKLATHVERRQSEDRPEDIKADIKEVVSFDENAAKEE